MTITEEAVQAAHSAICEENLDDCLEWRGKCVKAVEAAAPLIRADAKGEALEEAADTFSARLPDGTGNGRLYNSYRVTELLRARAAAVRGEG
jgi:hypothetical protein